MDLRQLEYFVAVAEEQNFTRAAARVHISQSGVSAQVRQLEKELGAALLDRTGRTATLTAAGAAALPRARAVLAAATAVRQAVNEVNGLLRGRLTVGMVTACTVTPLFDALASFRSDHPGVELTLLEDTSDRLADRIRTGAADLALLGAAGAAPPDLRELTVISEPIVAAVAPHHPLAGRPWLELDDLTGHPLVCLPKGTGIRAVLDQACAARSLRPQVALQAGAPGAVADLAARGLGIAVLSASMAAAAKERLVALPLRDVDQPAVLALVWRRTADPALHELVRHCRRTFAPPAGDQPA